MPCRDCEFLEADGGVIDGRLYPCNVDIGPSPKLAACMTAHIPDALHWPPARTFVRPSDGAECAFHKLRGSGS